MRPAMTQKQQVHRSATSAVMKRRAEAKRCPKCQRKSAMVRSKITGDDYGFLSVAVCRWCGHEKR